MSPEISIQAPVQALEAENGCKPFAGDHSQKVLILRRGQCNFATKVWHAEQVSALAVLIADDVTQMSENVVMLDDSKTDNIAIPSFMVRKSVFDTIKNESMATISIISRVQKQDKPKLSIWIAQGSSLKLN